MKAFGFFHSWLVDHITKIPKCQKGRLFCGKWLTIKVIMCHRQAGGKTILSLQWLQQDLWLFYPVFPFSAVNPWVLIAAKACCHVYIKATLTLPSAMHVQTASFIENLYNQMLILGFHVQSPNVHTWLCKFQLRFFGFMYETCDHWTRIKIKPGRT